MSRKSVIFIGGCLAILAVYTTGRILSGSGSSSEGIGIEIQDSLVQMDVGAIHRKIELPTIYIDGKAEVSNLITEQIYNEIIPEDFGQYYPGIVEEEIQYESEIINEKMISIHFSGYRSYWGSYEDQAKGLNFDLQTGSLISLRDYYTLADIKMIIEDARDAKEISVDIPLTEAGIEEEIDNFVRLLDSEEYISRTDVFFLKDNHIYFIVPCGNSMRGCMHMELSMDKFSELTEETQEDIERKRTPVEYRYMGDISGPQGFLDGENTIFWKDYYKDYKTILKKDIEYHIPICLQDFLQDYFSLKDPNEETWFPKDIYCMFYDERTIEMEERELEIFFLQNGYELSICKGRCGEYQVRFLQYKEKGSYLLYPEHIIMQTWNDNYIYVQEITGPMQRKVMDFISVDDRDNPLVIVHSTSMTRDNVSEEELSFWEFNGNFWSLVPMELEVDYTEAVMLEILKPGKEADFSPVYYPDGIVFRVSEQYDPIYMPEGEVTYKLEDGNIRYMIPGRMEEIEKNKSFKLIMVEKSLYWPAEGGYVKLEIKPLAE